MTKRFVILPILGILLIVFSTIVYLEVPSFLRNQIIESDFIGLYPNGTANDMTRRWADPEYDIRLSIWIFNVTNPDGVIYHGQAPKVVEKGPYTFLEKQSKKFNITTNGTRVIYYNNHQYFFSAIDSCPDCFLNDKVTVPNILLQKLVDAATSWITRLVIEPAIKIANESVFITVPVGDLLFNGYKDPLVSGLCDHVQIKSICNAIGIPDRIGIFYGQNNTDDGAYEVDTGVPDVLNIGKVYSWKNMTVLPSSTWYAPQARMINGTDGQLFKPFLENDKILTIFVGQICRSVEMEQAELVDYDGIKCRKYQPAASMNDVELQRRLGFCNPDAPVFFNDTQVQPRNCSPKGVMDVSSCVPNNVRIYITQPHFYGCPRAVGEAIEGMRRPSDDDKTFVLLEPNAGVVVKALRRSQLNVGVLPGSIKMFQNMTAVIVPLLWLNESAIFDPTTEAQMRQLSTVSRIANLVAIVSAALGIFLIIVNFVGCLVHTYYRQVDEPLLQDDEDDDEEEEHQQQQPPERRTEPGERDAVVNGLDASV